MGAKTEISWTWAPRPDGTFAEGYTFNPWIGCTKVSAGCANCLADGTLVLMDDGSWRPIESIQVGDRLAAFSECGSGKAGGNRLLELGIVERVWKAVKRTVEIGFSSGRSIVCSDDHKFLSFYPKSRRGFWLEAKNLSLESLVYAFGDPDTATGISEEYLCGYLAGATAGDGTMRIDGSGKLGTKQSYWRIAVLEDDKAILERIESLFVRHGLERGIKPFSHVVSKTDKPSRPMVKLEHRSMSALKKITVLMFAMDSREWKAGWLAGFFDTDGSVSGSSRSNGVHYRWSQKRGRNDYLQTAMKYLDSLGLKYTFEQFPGSKSDSVRLQIDTMNDKVSAVGIIRPALFRKGMKRLYGMKLGLQFDKVVSLRIGEEKQLNDIQVSTKTFVAEGLCTHNCYAETLMDKTYKRVEWGPGNPRSLTTDANWAKPLRWNDESKADTVRRRVFCASLADVFDAEVDQAWRERLFDLIEECHDLDWLLVTKRPENVAEMAKRWYNYVWPANVWMGVSVENQKVATERLPILSGIPAVVRFVSAEPLLGSFDLADHNTGWVICGGESGKNFRALDLDHARSLRDQCLSKGIPFYFKQVGGIRPTSGGNLLDGVEHKGCPVPRAVIEVNRQRYFGCRSADGSILMSVWPKHNFIPFE